MLDDNLWKPTALGAIGPKGFLSHYVAGDEGILYCPFHETIINDYRVDDALARRIQVVNGRPALARYSALLNEHPSLSGQIHIPDESWVGVLLETNGDPLSMAMLATPYWEDDRIGHLQYYRASASSLADQSTDALRYVVGLTLCVELAKRGFVGITCLIENPLQRAEVVAHTGLTPLRELLTSHGLLDEYGTLIYRPSH